MDAKSAVRIFASAPPPLLAALRQLLAAMFALQRADDPSSFEKVPLDLYVRLEVHSLELLSTPAARNPHRFADPALPLALQPCVGNDTA